MATIVLMEDDVGTRTLIASVLRKDGHEVLEADDGAQGLGHVETRLPDLVISDVQMPELNGFQVVASMRANPLFAATPIILLTSLQERAHMRIGMTAGADDFITKPFRPSELRDAVQAQLARRAGLAQAQQVVVDRAVRRALEEQRHQLAKLYEQRLARELSERWPASEPDAQDEIWPHATVLFADMPAWPVIAERLPPQALADLIKRFYSNANDTAHLFGAHHMQFVGEGLLLVFVDQSDTHTVSHGLRAVRAALGLVEAGRGMQQLLLTAHAGQGLPRLTAHVGLNAGPVTLTRLQDPLHGSPPQLLPVGDTVSVALQLQRQAAELHWPVAASANVLRLVSDVVQVDRRVLLNLPGRAAALELVEVSGLAH